MRIIFSPNKLEGVSLFGIMNKLKQYPLLGDKIISSIIYDNKFTECFLNILSIIHPYMDLIGNSFLQGSVLENLKEVDIYIFTSDCTINKYMSGNVYKSLYTQLKRSNINTVHINEDIELSYCVTEEEIIKDIIIIWKETHMGEITDAISKAIKDISGTPVDEKSTKDDRIKQAMADIGMPVNYFGLKNTSSNFNNDSVDNSVGFEMGNSIKRFMNEPCSDVEESSEESDEICYKVSDDKILIMIPKDTKMDEICVDGITFNTIMTSVPNLNCENLQIFSVLQQTKQNTAIPIKRIPTIKRVPIFIDKNDEEENLSNNNSDNSKLDSLKLQKNQLDLEIKQARKDGDEELVDKLRKQRRKVRNELNKLEV